MIGLRGPVASRRYPTISRIPPLFPFTCGYFMLAFDGMVCRAEDGRELIDRPVVSFQSTLVRLISAIVIPELVESKRRQLHVTLGRAVMRGTGKHMEVVKKVCHNAADHDSAWRPS